MAAVKMVLYFLKKLPVLENVFYFQKLALF